ncbi:signal peptidase I [Shewanella sp. 10N.286.51.B2]|uniref:signal peptidase I n=1 Tax=unclassified Shewanella TaxID=196818 RepID=UPI000C825764|nr:MULTISPECIES: signal peptidase I [unclassified Shewanella]MDO6620904.1 signal peptidase I [Shewanella sp. 6_MG-2023]MDO6641852.1 signal peptidase I [Shewanella sp. 5_MG-2023]MDO6776990.1 signal peptidase I [Shewanella sp. 3_MG-2023]PMI02271.1 signal peptidase I [Shewanella sp. 10N.286.48.A6]
MNNAVVKAIKANKSLLLFIMLMCVFRSAVADWYTVPSGSMKPTIIEGDRLYADKMAYDLRVPFTHISLYKIADPQRGDIIIFESTAADNRLVKRVIGIPGDVIALTDNVLSINGKTLAYQPISATDSSEDKIEQLFSETSTVNHFVRTSNSGSRLSNFSEVTVPEGHYLALGDNRDHSSDSRVIGFVPRDEIIAKTSSVVMSFDYDNYYIPRSERFLHSLIKG